MCSKGISQHCIVLREMYKGSRKGCILTWQLWSETANIAAEGRWQASLQLQCSWSRCQPRGSSMSTYTSWDPCQSLKTGLLTSSHWGTDPRDGSRLSLFAPWRPRSVRTPSSACYGVPEAMTSDRARQFTSALWEELCQNLKINHITTTAYHPQSNGLVEQTHRHIKDALRARLAGSRWPEHLPWVFFGLREVPIKRTVQ